jgi:hypothetical protein
LQGRTLCFLMKSIQGDRRMTCSAYDVVEDQSEKEYCSASGLYFHPAASYNSSLTFRCSRSIRIYRPTVAPLLEDPEVKTKMPSFSHQHYLTIQYSSDPNTTFGSESHALRHVSPLFLLLCENNDASNRLFRFFLLSMR